jgi:glycerophosphoryl diester phosphodiesterase
VAAFVAALHAGADGVELDVRRTADSVCVVHHDPDVPGAGAMHQLSVSRLPPWVPTLEEALGACAGAVVDVELKNSPAESGYDPDERMAGEVADLVATAMSRPDGPGAVFVTCFWPAALQAVRRARPELPTGLLVAPGFDAVSALDTACHVGAGVLLPFRAQGDARLVEAAHEAGVSVVPWAVDEEDDLRSAAGAGVDAVVTDHVGRALATLGRS